MCTCMHICMYTCVYVRVYVLVYKRVYGCACVCVCVCNLPHSPKQEAARHQRPSTYRQAICICMHICMYIHVYVQVYVSVRACVLAIEYVCVCVCVQPHLTPQAGSCEAPKAVELSSTGTGAWQLPTSRCQSPPRPAVARVNAPTNGQTSANPSATLPLVRTGCGRGRARASTW